MLCKACQEIFSSPRKLSYGTYYPWNQTKSSFIIALREGCHLCNVIEENRSYSNCSGSSFFPTEIKYAFKVLNDQWARHGNGPMWLVPNVGGDELHELERYLSVVEMDPTPNGLGHLLATDSDKLVDDPPDFWLMLELYGPRYHLVLPLELATRQLKTLILPFLSLTGVGDATEEIAQTNLNGQTSSGSRENLQLAKMWLHNCMHSHLSCNPPKTANWLPSRLLHVGSQDEPVLRLILSSSISLESQYAALSHRWGTNKGFLLTSANFPQYLKSIPVSGLSSTLRDAVDTTRGIGLQYLWVDSMCILQDDPEDWACESATMAQVYGLSTCTIAAANSGSADGGCFVSRNQFRIRPCSIPNPFKTDSKYSFYVMSQHLNQIHERDVRDSLWYNRGWVFQERTLSPRLLIFGKTQMLWACEHLQAAET
jgi:hypothetical protein